MNGPTTAPILGALGAALLFAFANNLQRGEASKVPHEDGGPVRLLLRLLRTPRWLAGSSAAVLALLLQAWALRLGGVILVQAVIASTLVFSLVLESLLDRRLPSSGAVGGAVLVVAGITVLVQLGRPGAGGEFETWGRAVVSGLVVAVAGGGALLLARRRPRSRRTAVVLGAAAGICFAVDAVFLRGLAGALSPLLPVVLVINVAGFAVASVLGNLVIQRAFQMAPLRNVLPAMAAAEPLTAVLVGRFLFGERLQSGLVGTLAVWGGLGLMVVGVVFCALGQVRPAVPPPSRVGGAS